VQNAHKADEALGQVWFLPAATGGDRVADPRVGGHGEGNAHAVFSRSRHRCGTQSPHPTSPRAT
jgi:hypothetical protein